MSRDLSQRVAETMRLGQIPMTARMVAKRIGETEVRVTDALRWLEKDAVVRADKGPRNKALWHHIKGPITYGGDITLLAMQSVCRARLMAREVEVI